MMNTTSKLNIRQIGRYSEMLALVITLKLYTIFVPVEEIKFEEFNSAKDYLKFDDLSL